MPILTYRAGWMACLRHYIIAKLISFHKNKQAVNHWLLAFSWILYCVSHSVFAATKVKRHIEKISGRYFRYYRLAYTVWSAIALILVIYFQYSFTSVVLFNVVAIGYISLIVLACPGLIIMMMSIVKYFKLLSGVRTLYEAKPAAVLHVKGLHTYVRHPLYLGTLLFIWGLFFAFPFLNNFIAVMIISLYVLIGIRLEEKKLLCEFGKDYGEYMARVPKLIPRFSRLAKIKKGNQSAALKLWKYRS